MVACPSCGHENADDARFCSQCATPLAPPEPARESRKVVTILFCDLVGSTALGESTDPEALRSRMRRYFEDLRRIIERHGGTVEKFVGDAVMAVFGIPVSHEDDALRAVRAASEMRAVISEHGLEARIGVNTGEVVVGGQGETLVTGDAVNVAARLEQAAPPGEMLIGAGTRMLVRDAVRVEAVEALVLKGKSEPVEAYRLLDLITDAAPLARHPETPLVGRERERQRLWRDFEDAVADRTCRLFTLLGPAGIGKSRLVADFLERVGASADVLRARCLHYGEGITYWPLVEMVVAIGVEPDSVIGSSPPETQLAFRRLLESRATERPQVVVIDDLQWAEPVFVDLVEHIADLSRDAPIFLLCVARTELLDIRPGWGGGKLNATSLFLEPLGVDECRELMERLIAGGPLAEELRAKITVASAGNPLFVEEMLAMVREGGDGEIAVPPTIQALLQARIDSLDSDVRVVMERGAVEGEVFHRGAVAELSPDPVRLGVEAHLATLVRKELIRSTAPTFSDDEGFRFRHLLIRDAAYESLPKATRAELHERFAAWLAAHDLVEGDEIVGYHLEQAHRYRAELDPVDLGLAGIGGRAAEHLSAAGNGAMDRGDWAAARGLLRRAWNLLPSGDERRATLAPELALALQETSELDEALVVAEEAREAQDPVVRARGVIVEIDIRYFRDVGSGTERHISRRNEARAILEDAGDDLGLAHYWRSFGYGFWARGRTTEAKDAWERGIEHAVSAGALRLEHDFRNLILSCVALGPTPVPEAIAYVEAVLRAAHGSALAEAGALRALGLLRSMEGRVDEGRALVARGRNTFREAGLFVSFAGMAMSAGNIERRAGDLEAEERVLRGGYDELERLDDRSFLPTVALYLADCIYRQSAGGDEVRALCAIARERTIPDDFVNFVLLDSIEACLLAREQSFDDAEILARRSLELAETTDLFDIRSRARLALAEVLHLAGDSEKAPEIAQRAIAVHEDKGDVAGAAAIRRRLEEIGLEVS